MCRGIALHRGHELSHFRFFLPELRRHPLHRRTIFAELTANAHLFGNIEGAGQDGCEQGHQGGME